MMEAILLDYAVYTVGSIEDGIMPSDPLEWIRELEEDGYYDETDVTAEDIAKFKATFAYLEEVEEA